MGGAVDSNVRYRFDRTSEVVRSVETASSEAPEMDPASPFGRSAVIGADTGLPVAESAIVECVGTVRCDVDREARCTIPRVDANAPETTKTMDAKISAVTPRPASTH